MKSIINGKILETDYPRLMKNKNGDIIMIVSEDNTGKGCGVVVAGYLIGTFSYSWHLNLLEDFHGEVVLSS